MSKWGNNTNSEVAEIPDLSRVAEEAPVILRRIMDSSKTMAENIEKSGRDPSAYLEAVDICKGLQDIIAPSNDAVQAQTPEVTYESPKLGG